jgi:protein SCO1/2
VIKELGAAADGMRFFFVSIDPERDTPSQLATYLGSFDPHITGLTGTAEEIVAVAEAYRVYYAKVPTCDGYTMNHSTVTYLMDRHGRFVDHIRYQEPLDKQVAKLRKLVSSAP